MDGVMESWRLAWQKRVQVIGICGEPRSPVTIYRNMTGTHLYVHSFCKYTISLFFLILSFFFLYSVPLPYFLSFMKRIVDMLVAYSYIHIETRKQQAELDFESI